MKKIFLLLFLDSCFFPLLYAENFSDCYKNAVLKEKSHQINEAILLYHKAAKLSPAQSATERIKLKIARITPDFEQKINLYNDFITIYPKSKLLYLVYYEKAFLYYLKEKYEEALKTYQALMDISFGTPYFTKAALLVSGIYLDQNKPDFVIENIYRILEDVADYEETAECYYFLGKAFLLKEKPQDAKDFFLICAGTFHTAYRARASLLELLKIAVKENNLKEGKKYFSLLAEKFPESLEYNEAQQLTKWEKNSKEKQNSESGLINLPFGEEKKTSILLKIQEELKNSNEIQNSFSGEKYFVAPGLYLQLGSYSEEANAQKYKEKLQEREIEPLLISRQMGSSGYLYKVIAGPFLNKIEANQKLIDLKDKGIDAFFMEISPVYE